MKNVLCCWLNVIDWLFTDDEFTLLLWLCPKCTTLLAIFCVCENAFAKSFFCFLIRIFSCTRHINKKKFCCGNMLMWNGGNNICFLLRKQGWERMNTAIPPFSIYGSFPFSFELLEMVVLGLLKACELARIPQWCFHAWALESQWDLATRTGSFSSNFGYTPDLN